jgi:hypothetical protein
MRLRAEFHLWAGQAEFSELIADPIEISEREVRIRIRPDVTNQRPTPPVGLVGNLYLYIDVDWSLELHSESRGGCGQLVAHQAVCVRD